MSQQEFRHAEQEGRNKYKQEQTGTYSPRFWFKQKQTSEMPKQEHPSSYTDGLPPYNYQAQEQIHNHYQQSERRSQAQYAPRQGFVWSMPREQDLKRWKKMAIWAVLGIIFIPLLLKAFFVALSIVAILLFSLLIFILVIAAIIAGVFFFARHTLRKRFYHYRNQFTNRYRW